MLGEMEAFRQACHVSQQRETGRSEGANQKAYRIKGNFSRFWSNAYLKFLRIESTEEKRFKMLKGKKVEGIDLGRDGMGWNPMWRNVQNCVKFFWYITLENAHLFQLPQLDRIFTKSHLWISQICSCQKYLILLLCNLVNYSIKDEIGMWKELSLLKLIWETS